MILASPWTQTLGIELRKVLNGHKTKDDIGLGLSRQLEEVGKAVLCVVGKFVFIGIRCSCSLDQRRNKADFSGQLFAFGVC